MLGKLQVKLHVTRIKFSLLDCSHTRSFTHTYSCIPLLSFHFKAFCHGLLGPHSLDGVIFPTHILCRFLNCQHLQRFQRLLLFFMTQYCRKQTGNDSQSAFTIKYLGNSIYDQIWVNFATMFYQLHISVATWPNVPFKITGHWLYILQNFTETTDTLFHAKVTRVISFTRPNENKPLKTIKSHVISFNYSQAKNILELQNKIWSLSVENTLSLSTKSQNTDICL